MYIDQTYYTSEYKGEPTDDFDRLEVRASEVVDSLTNYRVAQSGLDVLTTFQQAQFKKAVAAQVEHYALNGYETEGMSSVGIGRFNYSANESAGPVSDKVTSFLNPTGLMYRGVSIWSNRYPRSY